MMGLYRWRLCVEALCDIHLETDRNDRLPTHVCGAYDHAPWQAHASPSGAGGVWNSFHVHLF
jgi:hypothetical protein